jgi:hypothetical protein
MTLNGSADGSYSPGVITALKRKLHTTDREHEPATESGSEKCSSEQIHIQEDICEEEDEQEVQQNLQPVLVGNWTKSFEKDTLQGCSRIH